MRILGIDGALYGPAGFCVLDEDWPEQFVAGVLTFSPKDDQKTRMARLYYAIELWVTRYHVDAVAAEDAYHGRNAQTTIALARCGALAYAVALAQGLPFTLVNPLDTGRVRVTLPGALLRPAVAAIPQAQQEHAECAAAIAWHGRGILEGSVISGASIRRPRRVAAGPRSPARRAAKRKGA